MCKIKHHRNSLGSLLSKLISRTRSPEIPGHGKFAAATLSGAGLQAAITDSKFPPALPGRLAAQRRGRNTETLGLNVPE